LKRRYNKRRKANPAQGIEGFVLGAAIGAAALFIAYKIPSVAATTNGILLSAGGAGVVGFLVGGEAGAVGGILPAGLWYLIGKSFSGD
jgi:hypothetical protein